MNEANIKLICDRNFGVGSDGILYGPIFNNDEISLRILNPDGTEAEKSGNGIRIFSKYLADVGHVKENQFSISTLGGKVSIEILDIHTGRIKVGMGKAIFKSELIPVNGKTREVLQESLNINDKSFEISCVSVGNPHCVVLTDNLSKEIALKYGSKIENNSLFPN